MIEGELTPEEERVTESKATTEEEAVAEGEGTAEEEGSMEEVATAARNLLLRLGCYSQSFYRAHIGRNSRRT